jgi:hypothetical protein
MHGILELAKWYKKNKRKINAYIILFKLDGILQNINKFFIKNSLKYYKPTKKQFNN